METNAIQLSVQYLQAGDFERAEETVRQLLRAEPSNFQGLCLLGRIRQARGRPDEALVLFQQAVNLDSQSADAYNLAGLALAQLRQPDRAKAYLEEALRLNPFHAAAFGNLGKVHLLHDRGDEALACFREAVRLQPNNVEAVNNLALVLIARREFHEARAVLECVDESSPAYPLVLISLSLIHFEMGELPLALSVAERVVQIQPQLPAARNQAGAVLLKMERYEEAAAHLQASLQVLPDQSQTLEHLGLALQVCDRLDEAETCLRRAVELDPANPRITTNWIAVLLQQERGVEALEAATAALQRQTVTAELHYLLGLAHRSLKQFVPAIAALNEAVKLRPDYPEALYALGLVYLDIGNSIYAATPLQQALRLRPNFPEVFCSLGQVYNQTGKLDESCEQYEQALRLKPDFAEALGGLANTYKDIGRTEEAIACYRKSLALDPSQTGTYSNFLFTLHYSAEISPEQIFQEHLTWAKHHAVPPAILRPHSNEPNPERRLRLGYVSADFREHVMGRYVEMILEARDRQRFEVYCYSNSNHQDDTNHRLRALADHWRDVQMLSEEALEARIREDQIDVLVDLSGHTGGNRLSLFARKPAPVQVTHFGYQFSSGNAAIDYQISDSVCDPPGMTERIHTEQIVRLPDIHWCYRPNCTVEINPLPALANGYATFGFFNAFPKITPPALAAWARILQRLPNSRLLALANISPRADRQFRETLSHQGIHPNRVTLVGRQALADYFQLYRQVDVALDSFPYTGCNTTCDSLWMGVPVVMLAGRSGVARQGASPLFLLGLSDLVTDSVEEYVETAIRLAQDLPRLQELRATLREQMRGSTLMNVERFTRQLEEAYRAIWLQWCRKASDKSS
jgi:predicted O-linked N-acetylglucosamine transferase (SPINDLY family)